MNAPTASRTRFAPLPLPRAQDTVVVVAPSSPFDVDGLNAGLTRLREHFLVGHDPGLLERTGFLAGTDARRSSELLAALSDDRAFAILAARGGHGATRLLPNLHVERVRAGRKLLIGLSDITALHALWQRAGLRSVHGTMAASLGKLSATAWKRWVAVVGGSTPEAFTGLEVLAPGRAHAPLVGGNLSLLAALIGTPYAPPVDACVLFLEDVGERPYRIDRMLTTLEQAGWLARVAGVVLGTFTDCEPGPDGMRVEDVLRERLGQLRVPVLAGLPVGHCDDSEAIVFGAPVELDGSRAAMSFLEGACLA